MSATIRVGISGWRYAPWRGTFYPPKLSQKRELAFASRLFGTIEINGSFYSLQRPESWRRWYDETPDGFVFAVKGPRFITHMKKLSDCETPLANFFASGVLRLEEKLGPVLWQLPPNLGFNPEKLEAFLAALPRTTTEAAFLARRHDHRLDGRDWLESGAARPVRHAFEVRHDSFCTKEFLSLLRRYEAAVVVADTAGRWPCLEEVTSDFVYLRLHGDKELYVSGYTSRALGRWAERIRELTTKRKVKAAYVYFDNDVKIRAPYDAAALMRKLGLAAPSLVMHGGAGIDQLTARNGWPEMRAAR